MKTVNGSKELSTAKRILQLLASEIQHNQVAEPEPSSSSEGFIVKAWSYLRAREQEASHHNLLPEVFRPPLASSHIHTPSRPADATTSLEALKQFIRDLRSFQILYRGNKIVEVSEGAEQLLLTNFKLANPTERTLLEIYAAVGGGIHQGDYKRALAFYYLEKMAYEAMMAGAVSQRVGHGYEWKVDGYLPRFITVEYRSHYPIGTGADIKNRSPYFSISISPKIEWLSQTEFKQRQWQDLAALPPNYKECFSTEDWEVLSKFAGVELSGKIARIAEHPNWRGARYAS